MITHAYLKYAMALLMGENKLSCESEVSFDQIKIEIQKGLDAFSVQPKENYEGKTEVYFEFVNKKNKASNFVYLAPNIISDEMHANNLYDAANKICETKELNLDKQETVSTSQIPTAGEFCNFSDNGNIGRGKPKSSNLWICLGLISSTTQMKPCLKNKNSDSYANVCLIPDLEIPQLIDFITLFKRMLLQKCTNLMVGKVVNNKPHRPKIFMGNFPDAPYSCALGAVALLGAIGEMAKDKNVSNLAYRVLESFKGNAFYAFRYGDAQIFHFDHHIIELAEKSQLRKIVYNLDKNVELYKQGRQSKENEQEYQKFALFAGRFLQLFNLPSFKDFLSFRAEYPKDLDILFITYFIQMEKISKEIVQSAKELGHWLNKVAFMVAKAEIQNGDHYKQIQEIKAKVLVDLESAIFSSKSGDALIAHTIARAGRLSGTDVPAQASLFMETTISGELSLEQAKHMLIAFSRLRFSAKYDNEVSDVNGNEPSNEEDDTQDYGDI